MRAFGQRIRPMDKELSQIWKGTNTKERGKMTVKKVWVKKLGIQISPSILETSS